MTFKGLKGLSHFIEEDFNHYLFQFFYEGQKRTKKWMLGLKIRRVLGLYLSLENYMVFNIPPYIVKQSL